MLLDPYVDPKTGVLYNKLGIKLPKGLRTVEYEVVLSRSAESRKSPIRGRFDLPHLQAIHKYLFQDVYEWAGKLRTINIIKGDSLFCLTDYLQPTMDDIHKNLTKNNFLLGLDKAEFVTKLTGLFGDLNAVHPFREGNGRSTREFIGQLAKEAGYTLDQSRIEQDKVRWNRASALTMGGKMDEMKAIFTEITRPTRALAFERLLKETALARFPELDAAYKTTEKARRYFSSAFPGNLPEQEKAIQAVKAQIQEKLDAGETRNFSSGQQQPKIKATPSRKHDDPEIER